MFILWLTGVKDMFRNQNDVLFICLLQCLQLNALAKKTLFLPIFCFRRFSPISTISLSTVLKVSSKIHCSTTDPLSRRHVKLPQYHLFDRFDLKQTVQNAHQKKHFLRILTILGDFCLSGASTLSKNGKVQSKTQSNAMLPPVLRT